MNLPDGYFLQDGKYQLTRVIGQGGFGITYLGVWNTVVKGELGAMKTKVPVCIKEYFFKDYCYRDRDTKEVMVHSETGKTLFDKFKEKLIKEANILSEVHHPYIVNVLEVFEENNTAYIVMEYITGCSLKYMLEQTGVLPEQKVLKYTHQIGNALDFVHEKNIVHLDIKPSNILIDRDDNARLIDFGVSKRYDIEQQETSTTMLTLSKGFASIEQYDDEGTQVFSPCPDIYSLGATMYNLLTGVIPIESILRATKPILKPSAYNSNITSKTEKAILKAMEIKPSDRFQSVKEMLAALDVPPYELAENTLVETKDPADEEKTEILSSSSDGNSSSDEDCTVLNSPTAENAGKNTKRKHSYKRRALLAGVLLLFAFVGYAIFSYFSVRTKPEGSNSGIDMPGITNSFENNTAVVMPENGTLLIDKPRLDSTQTASKPSPVVEQQPNKAPTQPNHSDLTKPTPRHEERSSEVNNALLEKEYKELLSSAKAKMEKHNYADARTDLMKAMEKKATNEAITFIQICNEKEEEAKISDRLSQYEIFDKIDFGNLKIVRKKANNMYGAIDKKGIESIRCRYINVDKSVNGRAFQRSDNLYDIYNEKGKCVASGLKSFE